MSFQDYLNNGANTIIENWIRKVEENIPNVFDLTIMKKNGFVYFQLLRDIHIPIELHPSFHIIPTMTKYYVDQGTPVEQILHVTHIWRECLVEYIFDVVLEQIPHSERKETIGILHKRIDTAQRHISSIYIEQAKILIKKREQEIDQLHADRLNTLGKMAASMAHEIKNPLFAIEGFLKLIREELSANNITSDNIERYLDVVDKEFEGLYGQITSFLSFSKNNSDSEPFIQQPVNQLIQSVINLATPRLIDENITAHLLLKDNFNLCIQKIAIQQVLSNIVTNSIEALQEVTYSKAIKVYSSEDESSYYIHIVDNGPGISEEIGEKIFEPFITGKSHGTGLGLSICKQIMEKNNGDLNFTSTSGDTIFTMSFKKIPANTKQIPSIHYCI